MKRKIINIDQEKCTGCSLCIPNCPEGAIQVIDGKARLVSDLLCDGLGACLGHCPEGAIVVEEREAEAYDERKVMLNMIKQGSNTIKAHLEHLKSHQQCEFLDVALAVLAEKGIVNPLEEKEAHMTHNHGAHAGCPGAKSFEFNTKGESQVDETGKRPSQLSQWPIQMHLISPMAPQYQGADLLLSADCVAYSLGDFHKDWLKGKTLAIACPKLDDGQEVYVEKIKSLIDDAKINTLTVMIMEVPCCGGLMALAKQATEQASRKVPIKRIVVGIQGGILSEDWM
jgi:NAD-dependent dihydropyrimidine dehydrogenase PreA subunit